MEKLNENEGGVFLKRKIRPWLHMILVAALLASLLPAYTASAAPQITIMNIHKAQYDLVNGRPDSRDEPNITRVTTQTIDLVVEIQGMTNEQISSLYLAVSNMTTGISDEIRTILPARNGEYGLIFNNVPLTEGLNRVVVKLGGTTVVESQPGWVYFTSVSNITDLKINEQLMVESRFYPANPDQSTIVNITGFAQNATEILADLYGSTGPVNGYLNDGEFFFVGDDVNGGTPSANLRLTPGDNIITFIARNNLRSFQTTKNIIYDNGRPFAYQLTVNENGSAATPSRLITNPTLNSPDVDISGLIKVDINGAGVPIFDRLEVRLPGGTAVYDLENLDPLDTTLRLNAALSTSDYNIYTFNRTFAAGTGRIQTIEFAYSSDTTTTVVTNSFFYYYENPNLPYIQYVERAMGSGGTFRISEAARSEINEQPARFYVYTNTNAGSITYEVGNGAPVVVTAFQTSADNAAIPAGLRRFQVDLSGIPVGNVQVKFTPRDGANASNDTGARTFTFLISSAPYVIFQNVHNGMVLTNSTALTHIRARFVNTSAIGQIQLSVNSSSFIPVAADFTNGDFGTRLLNFSLAGNSVALNQGSNTIRVVIYEDATRRTIAVDTTITVFLFSQQAPEFISVEPVETTDEDKYRSTNVLGTYVTNERAVVLRGRFANVPQNSNVSVTVSNTPNPRVNYFSSVDAAAGTFETYAVELAESGDTIFTFSLTNATNIIVTRTIVITREPLPYVIVYPKMRENANGVHQANINSNFVEFQIDAENADAVLYNGKPAAMRTVRDPDTNMNETHYFFEVTGLKNGRNNIKFTVVRGTESLDAEVIVNNVNQPTLGATYKSKIANRLRVFNNQLEVSFQRNTSLQRNDATAVDKFITTDRQILFGIADEYDGRVDKYKHPASYDGQIGNPNALISSTGRLRLTAPDRFTSISPLYWIDAGTIDENEDDLNEALEGSGGLPYDNRIFYTRQTDDLVVPSQPGTLTLKYDSSVRRDAWKYVTVYHYDIFEDYRGVTDWRWRNAGGVVNPANNTITVPLERFGYYQVMYMDQSFDDIISHDWARDYLDIMFSKGIMFNKSNLNFIPNDPISRGEFVSLLVKIFEIPLNYSETPTFSDVLRVNPLTNGLYDYMHIETAAKAGIVRGAGGGRFQPNSSITRQDAAVMIARAANMRLSTNASKVLADLQKQFTDANAVDVYAQPSVLAVVDSGFIQGRENVLLTGAKATFRFDPTATMTRAETAAVAYRVLASQKKIPR